MFVVNVSPPSVLNAPQNWASSFGLPLFVSPGPPSPRSLRQSYQVTTRFPLFWSIETAALNWLFFVLCLVIDSGADLFASYVPHNLSSIAQLFTFILKRVIAT